MSPLKGFTMAINRHHIWIDLKYAQLLSTQLSRFQVKSNSPYNANFRCPYCGDSKKNAHKARGYIKQRENRLAFKCYNCGKSVLFSTLLRDQNSGLYSQYMLDIIAEREPIQQPVVETRPTIPAAKPKFSRQNRWMKITDLPLGHPARSYLANRRLPVDRVADLFHTDNFYQFVNSEIGPVTKYSEKAIKNDHPRIIIPLYTADKQLFGVQGRTYRPQDARRPKYLTAINHEFVTHPLVFGLEHIDASKPIIVVEGPFDSMFLDNAIATCGAQSVLATLSHLPYDSSRYIITLDNDKRNADIVEAASALIDRGYTVSVWPNSFKWNDVNSAIIDGRKNPSEINQLIHASACRGILAKIKLSSWKRVSKTHYKSRSYNT